MTPPSTFESCYRSVNGRNQTGKEQAPRNTRGHPDPKREGGHFLLMVGAGVMKLEVKKYCGSYLRN